MIGAHLASKIISTLRQAPETGCIQFLNFSFLPKKNGCKIVVKYFTILKIPRKRKLQPIVEMSNKNIFERKWNFGHGVDPDHGNWCVYSGLHSTLVLISVHTGSHLSSQSGSSIPQLNIIMIP